MMIGTLVTYESDNEVLVTTLENEQELIRAYFTEGDRDLNEYDREVGNFVNVNYRVHVSSNIKV